MAKESRIVNNKVVEALDALSGKIDGIDDRIGKMDNRLQFLEVSVVVFSLAVIITGFCIYATMISIQDFSKDRIAVLQKVSYSSTLPSCDDQATAFGLSYKGFAMDVSVSHYNCSSDGPPSYVLACPKVDIALFDHCPSSGYALNGDMHTNILLGDEVVSYGFSKFSKAWKGMLLSEVGKDESNFPPFQGLSNVPADAYMFSGLQDRGMSGGAVVNSYGLVGLASTAFFGSTNVRYSGVIPLSYVFRCVEKYAAEGKLKSASECPGTKVVNVPVLFSVSQTFQKIATLFNRFLYAHTI